MVYTAPVGGAIAQGENACICGVFTLDPGILLGFLLAVLSVGLRVSRGDAAAGDELGIHEVDTERFCWVLRVLGDRVRRRAGALGRRNDRILRAENIP